MAAVVLGGAWAAVVLIWSARRRPDPGRVRRIVAHPGGRAGPARVAPTTGRLGRLLGRLLGTDEPAAIRSWGRAGAVALALVLVVPPLAPLPLLAAWARPRWRRRRAVDRHRRHLEASLPECVDLLALAVGAGCNVSMAVGAAARRGSGPAAEQLAQVLQDTGRGRRLADALDALPARGGEALRPLAAALAGCERYGAPLVASLERLGDEVRRQRQRRAEEAARKVPVLLVFPLVVCILPAFALLTVAPLIASALRELRL